MSHRLNEQGSVRLAIRVESSGSASHVAVVKSSGYPRLDDAAIKAAYRWRYLPRNGGTPVPGTYEYVLRFEITD
jgi:protein TonB